MLGYHSLLKHEKLNKNVEVVEEEESEEEEKEEKIGRHSLLKSSIRTDTRSSESGRKIRSVKSAKNKNQYSLANSVIKPFNPSS